jgi:peptidyl-prolyl cis-trans isomerase C
MAGEGLSLSSIIPKDLFMSRLAVLSLTVLLSGIGMAQGPVPSHAPTSSAILKTSPDASAVVAKVNGVAVTEAQLRQQEEAIFPYFKMHNGTIPATAKPEIHRQPMDKLILDELLYQECQRRHTAVPEAKYQKGIRDLKNSFKSPQDYRAAVIKKYGSMAAFDRQLRRTLVVNQLWDDQVKSRTVVTDVYLRNYYQTNQKRFIRPESVSLQSISFMFPKDATLEQKKLTLKRASEELPKAKAAKNYEEFGLLAEKVSEDQWKVMMGDHKLVHRGEVDPQFEVIYSMKPNETTGLIESSAGIHILRVNEHQAQRQMPFSEIKDRLRKDLQAKRYRDRADQFEKDLRKKAIIVEM